nr:transcriptional repressor [uncultured Pseudodesulfovibrio sp.]
MDTEKRLRDIIDGLKDRGNRLTPQRVAILRAIVENDSHPSAEQIHKDILPDFPTTSLATVYKTITLLKNAGEILELGFGDDGNRYDGLRPTPHPHLICTKCGMIMDTDLDNLDHVVSETAKKSGFSVHSHRFDIFGLCPSCKE